MKPYQRVASRYFRARSSLPENYKIDFRRSGWDGSLKIELYYRLIMVGISTANFEKYTVEEISKFKCGEEMIALINRFPELIDSEGNVRVVEVTLSRLDDPDYRGKGLGLLMYENMISGALSQNDNMPFLFIPNYCHRRSTSASALRVWKSLARRFDNEGDVLAILKTP